MNTTDLPTGKTREREPLLAITLCSSNAPIPMPVLNEDWVRGLAVFKSRRREDGRERFRLHVGYFQTVAEAERVLALLRPAWPQALVSAVPDADLGSLDNTAMTRFSILQPPATPPQPPPPTINPPVTVRPIDPLPPSAVPPPVLKILAKVPVEPRYASSAVAGEVPSLQPAIQRYAVQLAFGREPIDLASLPDLAIYEGYLLYAIEAQPGGRRLYGVRLGFYDDVLSARLVAQYVRSEFRDVTIVPVSEREVLRATESRIRLQVVRAAKGRGSSLPLWPHTALTVPFDPASHLPLVASGREPPNQ